MILDRVGALPVRTHGLMTIKERGGIAVVQDPGEAAAPMMPLSAIQAVDVDHVVAVNDIATLLKELVMTPVTRPARLSVRARIVPRVERDIADLSERAEVLRGVLLQASAGRLRSRPARPTRKKLRKKGRPAR